MKDQQLYLSVSVVYLTSKYQLGARAVTCSTVFQARLYGRYMEIKNNIKNEIHGTNQGSNSDNVRAAL